MTAVYTTAALNARGQPMDVTSIDVEEIGGRVIRGSAKQPDLIKIDTETSEPFILRAIKELLKGDNGPDIISEVMPPTLRPLYDLLVKECGYSCLHITPQGIEPVDKLNGRLVCDSYSCHRGVCVLRRHS